MTPTRGAPAPSWSPELEFTARLAGVQPASDDLQRASALAAGDLEWGRVLRLARHHRVAPVVHVNMARSGIRNVPPGVVQELKLAHATAVKRNLRAFASWVRVTRGLEERGLSVLTFKGFHTAQSVYPDFTVRPMADLDLLVRVEELPRALDALREIGCRIPPRWEGVLQRIGLERFARSQPEMSLVSPEGVPVDLHWRTEWSNSVVGFPTSLIFEEAERVQVEGHDFLVPSGRISLVLSLLHAHGSGWGRLQWLVDIAGTLDRLEAHELRTLAAGPGGGDIRRALRVACALIGSLWGRLPTACSDSVASARDLDRDVKGYLRATLEADRDWQHAGSVSRAVRVFRSRLHARGSYSRLLASAVRPNMRDWLFVPLPGALWFGYYLVRPLRVLVQSTLGPLQGWLRRRGRPDEAA